MNAFPFGSLPLTEAIPEIRRRLAMTDADIAAELGVHVRTVRWWASGRHVPVRKMIRPLQAIARRANVEIIPESTIQ